MKTYNLSSIVLSCVVAVSALGAGGARAEQIQLPERVFSPLGFDSNDNSEIVLYGHFPDTCYQAGPAKFAIHGREIRIRNVALHWDAGSCLKAPVPWSTTVTLGALTPGTYSVSLETSDGQLKYFTNFTVAPSMTRRTDDYPYAYVNGAIMNRSSRGGSLTMSGTYSLTCMEISEIRVKESNAVIVVLPIVRLRTDVPCGHPFAPIPFIKRVALHPRTDAPTLVHIRSMNGQALNQVYDY